MHHDPARPGELLQLDLTVTNTDSFTRNDVTLTMEFPAGINQLFESATFSGDCPGTACETGETVTWQLGSISADGHTTVVMPAIVANATTAGTVITFSAAVADSGGGSDADGATVTVESPTRFDLALSENSDPARPGDALGYKITWGYRADSAAVAEAALEFTLPAGTTFVSASDGGSLNGSVVSWPLGFVAPGDSGIREVSVAVDNGIATPAVIEASAQLTNLATPSETATAGTGTVIADSAPLSLVIESNANPARPDEYVNFNMIVTNNDPFTRFGVVLTAQHPQELRQLFESTFDGDCASTACEAGERITWTLGDLPAGASVSVDLPGRAVGASVDGELINLFLIATDSQGLQAKQSDTIRVQDDALFDLALAEDADPVAPGDQLSYRLHFGHRGDAAAVSDSMLLFRLPVGTSFVSASDGGALSNGMVSWALGNLSPGQGGTRDVTVALDGALPASSMLETWAEIQNLDVSPERARAEAATSIADTSPLALTFESNPQPARPDVLTRVQLTVTNNDPFTRFGVELTTRHPEDAKQLFEAQFGGDCASTACEANEKVSWAIGDIPAGGSRSVDYPVAIRGAVVDGVLLNLYATAMDDQNVQVRATDALRTQSNTIYDLALAESSDPVSAGETLNYQLTFGYRSDAASTNDSRLRLALPAGVSFVSASDGGTVSSGEVQWALGALMPGEGGQRRVEVTVDAGLADAAVLEAEAIIEATGLPLELARARATSVVASSRPLSLSIEANPKPARPGETSNIQLVIANNDPFPRFGVTLSGQFPQDVSQLFESQFDGNCSSTACESGELVGWDAGDIAAGGSATLQLPATMSGANLDGLLVNLFLTAADDQGFQTRHSDTIRISSDNPYEIAVSEDLDPALAGEALNYEVSLGYRSDAAMVRESELVLTLPAGVTPTSATGNGAINGGRVTWALGSLLPGVVDTRGVTAIVDAGADAGAILDAHAHVYDAADPLEGARAESSTVVSEQRPLSLSIDSAPNPAQPSDTLLLLLSVTNNDPFPRFGVTLLNRYPQGVGQLFESAFGGNCPSTACESGELITWSLGEMTAGEVVTVDLPPTVSASVLEGELIDFFVHASDDTGVHASALEIVRVGDPVPVIDLLFKDSFESP